MSYLQRRDPDAVAGRAGMNGPLGLADAARFPALVEFLFCDEWPDGTPRRPGTLLCFGDEGKLKMCLSDRDQGLVCFVTAGGLSEGLDCVEQLLREGDGDWRPQRGGGKKGTK